MNVLRVSEREHVITGITAPYYALRIEDGEVTRVNGYPHVKPPLRRFVHEIPCSEI